ncbi:MAG: CrcB family protein [Rhodoferax sp.]|nr:CrcB family protein [Actinomycetota bacterium]
MSGPGTTLLVAAAGGLGAAARFAVDSATRSRWATAFPWSTVAINVTGSLLLGLLTGLLVSDGAAGLVRTVLGTGFCGGYTTFSTASVETVRLLQLRRYAAAAGNAVGSLVLSVAAGGLGLWLGTR